MRCGAESGLPVTAAPIPRRVHERGLSIEQPLNFLNVTVSIPNKSFNARGLKARTLLVHGHFLWAAGVSHRVGPSGTIASGPGFGNAHGSRPRWVCRKDTQKGWGANRYTRD